MSALSRKIINILISALSRKIINILISALSRKIINILISALSRKKINIYCWKKFRQKSMAFFKNGQKKCPKFNSLSEVLRNFMNFSL